MPHRCRQGLPSSWRQQRNMSFALLRKNHSPGAAAQNIAV